MLGSAFAAAVRLRNALYDSRLLRARRLQGPVVSVGNLSVGGAGKTPFVIALGELLQQRGVVFDVLSRGYGRRTRGVREVDPAGAPADFGDEPLLIARRLNITVVVGESRYEAGAWSETKYGSRLHLLDDGFQHRQLARDFDIVLLTDNDLRDRLLPAGRLREPLSSLARADAIVVGDNLDPTLIPLRDNQALWCIRRGIEILPTPSLASSVVDPKPAASAAASQSKIENQKSKILVAFCAIARPSRFFDDLRNARISTADEIPFPDHHRYNAADIEKILAAARRHDAAGFITTEKDLINLGPLAARLQPLTIARVTLELLDSAAALDRLLVSVRANHR